MKFRKPSMRGRAVTLTGVAVMIAATVGVISAPSVSAAGTTVYDAIPAPIPGNVPSLGFEATSTREFGDQVGLASNPGPLIKARVLMSSWGCENGGGVTCTSSPGSTFNVPITFKVYAVNAGPTVGALLKSKTQTFAIPYRPSADLGPCPGGQWFDGSNCFNGFATPITFDLTTGGTVSLPSQVIWTVSYNTSHHGYAPLGELACFSQSGGCGYDSLNVGLAPTNTVGTDVDPDGAFWNTTFAGFYCDNGAGGTGTLRYDTGVAPNCTAGNDWTGYTPSAELELANVPGAPRPTSAVPGNGSIKVIWKAPASNGGSAITGYVVTPYKANVAQTPVTFNSTATTQVITGLTNGTAYTFKVAAKNAQGTGPQSPATGMIIAGAPGRSGNVTAAQGAAAGRLKVTFTVPASNGAKISGYSAVCKSSNGGALVSKSRAAGPIGLTGATSGKSYRCTVFAKNSRGTGPGSLASTPPVIAP